MTNQQAPEIYTLHTVPNKGERPWSGIYTVRADAEHDAKVMRDATGRDWSVVRLVVADAAATPTGPNGAGPWVRYEDHVAALVEAQQPDPSAAAASKAVLAAIRAANLQLVRTGDDEFMLVPYKRATAEQQAAPKAAPVEPVNGWPVEAKIYKRRDEWVLELSGAINDCAFTCRHTQPGYLQPEDVAGLPSLYSEGIAPQPSPTPQADSQPAPEYVGNGMFKGETIQKATEHWASWCDVRCMNGLAGFLRVVAARAPADSVTAPAGGVDDDVDAIALARYKVVPAHESMFHRFAVVAGDGKQQLYLGREVECENMARKFAGAFLDGAFYQSNIAPTPPAQAADSVLEDAARLDWLLLHISGAEFRRIGVHYSGNARRADVDAARKQGANHD